MINMLDEIISVRMKGSRSPRYKDYIRIGEEMQQYGYGITSSSKIVRTTPDGYVLWMASLYDPDIWSLLPWTWQKYIRRLCGCLQIHKTKVECSYCHKKQYAMGYYPSKQKHYCVADAQHALNEFHTTSW